MHESSIARQILTAAIEQARVAGARHVSAVRGWVAETESLSADSVAFHFEACARGTLAEGARLVLSVSRIEARCGDCDLVYEPEHHVLLCPRCESTEAVLAREPGLGVESIEVE
ncbi:hydrogenase maturation nickel metallochaperone HypA/HybF [Nannocystis bainbridge]|uniref:Hydrogenase maturation factor HypA n=1 Tax=Nannocystis bainbridge TaxID=2995303 RepID=A0ABT5E4U3_9BACT|nr:hydrogenase maturation nickel metallochaperone HypA [Nannocystis bainbridge]MDC0720861.1 hydrogenase maturation nickel metallochaperone HypA [Nannocystis bainbridge]